MPETSTDPAATQQPERPKESYKEMVESILIAFILAFVFRAFVVEAFVIPSGSMAPTLLGAHMRMTCQECGWEFEVGISPRPDQPVPDRSLLAYPMNCPNCGFKVPQTGDDPQQVAYHTPIHYGDRILVLKYLYLLQSPHRWDVVVFKSPTDPEQNFIKRLVGLPGEMVMLLDGDVYVCPRSQVPDGVPVEQWPWQVQTKPRSAQEALWRIIYDNDHYPSNTLRKPEERWKMPWQPVEGSGWDPGGENGPGRILRFANLAGSGTLQFQDKSGMPELTFRDWLPYNQTMHLTVWPDRETLRRGVYNRDSYGDGDIPTWYVSDLKLRFTYQRNAGDGPLQARMSKNGHVFTAEFTPGKVRLLHRPPRAAEYVVSEATIGDARGPLDVEFTNVDYRVAVRVDGKDRVWTTPQQYAPDIPALLQAHERFSEGQKPTVQIMAARQEAQISHLSLWRDIYYTPRMDARTGSGLQQGSPERPVELHVSGERRADGTPYENEYFVLGDNSISSSDARVWTQTVSRLESEDLLVEPGRVPERFMLGKAFFVYWPAGYRVYSPSTPGLVPNFGDMRFIH